MSPDYTRGYYAAGDHLANFINAQDETDIRRFRAILQAEIMSMRPTVKEQTPCPKSD